jgi:hypothetical protein
MVFIPEITPERFDASDVEGLRAHLCVSAPQTPPAVPHRGRHAQVF